MKILQLKLQNINSLAGVHEINFTAPAFTQDGLFAITGKTGAGKTSILDAISLALYGKTPRVDVTGAQNPIMTRGERDCLAEITFVVNGKTWKSSWKQAINRNGNLNPVQRMIADADDRIHADQVRSCDTKIVEILGLTFDQFTKVIMLAQGSFAAFLQANKNEKGELLEQITGTEIYGQISRNVFERYHREKSELNRINVELAAIRILSTEEVEQLQAEIRRLQADKKQLDEALKQEETAANWLRTLSDLEKQIANLLTQLPALEAQSTAAEEALTKSRLALDEAKAKQKAQAPLIKQVRDWDTQLESQKRQLQPILSHIDQLDNEKTQLDAKFDRLSAELSTLENELTEKKKWAAEHQLYESLIADYNRIASEHQLVQAGSEELKAVQAHHTKLEHELTQKQAAVVAAQKDYASKKTELDEKKVALEGLRTSLQQTLGDRSIRDLQNQKSRVIDFGRQLKELIDNTQNMQKSQQEIEKQKAAIVEAEQLAEQLTSSITSKEDQAQSLEQHLTTLAENITLSRTILSLEQHRHELQDGKPCPLCGALEHPFATKEAPRLDDKEEELRQRKVALASLQRDLEKDKQAKMRAELAKEHAHNNQDNAQEQLAHQLENLGRVLEELQEVDSSFKLPEEPNRLTQLEALRQGKLAEFTSIDQQIKQAEEADKSIAQLRDHEIPTLEMAAQRAERAQISSEAEHRLSQRELETSQQQVEKLHTKQAERATALSAKLSAYGVSNLDDLKNCLDTWNKNKHRCEELGNVIINRKGDLALADNERRNKTELLQSANKENLELEQAIAALSKQREEHYGQKSTTEEEQKLEEALQQAEKALHHAQEVYTQLTTRRVSQQNLVASKKQELSDTRAKRLTDQPLAELEIAIAEKKRLSDRLSQQIGGHAQQLADNTKQQEAAAERLQAKEKQQESFGKWAVLNDLIGSQDGKKYRNFAQALTFEYLIDLANQQLQKMSDRYLLKRTGDSSNPFDLLVIDKFQNGEERTAQNLSGGEKFIMSLSLALGLANMASKNMRIDTMFIDEGFGTLDSDYLDVALSALSNLQSEGKIIGVISHLTELKERIATHIEIIPSGNGHSRIQIAH